MPAVDRVAVRVQNRKAGWAQIPRRLEELPDDVVVRVVTGRIRADRPVGDDHRRTRVVRHGPVERDGRSGHRAENRLVAVLGALDDDIRLGRALEVVVCRADDLVGDRIAELSTPVRTVERIARVR